MKSMILFSALCAVALGSHWAGLPAVPHDTPAVAAARAAHLAAHAAAAHGHVGLGALGVAGLGVAGLGVHGGWAGHGLGYAGGWAHGGPAPLGPNGVVVDTPEVAAAKAQHLHAVAAARSGGHGGWDDGSWHGDNGQWNGDNGQWHGGWAGHDNGQWQGGWAGHGAGHDGQWHGEGVVDGAAFSGAGGVYAGGHGIWNNGQWNAALWGDGSGHGHRWRRSFVHGLVAPAATIPLAHTVAVAPVVHHYGVVAPAVAVGHLGLGHGLHGIHG